MDALARTREKAILLSMGVEIEESDDSEEEELNCNPVCDPLSTALDYEMLSSEFGLRLDRVGAAESPPQNMAGATESPPQNPHPLSESGITGSRLFTVPTPHSHSHEGEKLSQEMAGATESPPQNPHPLSESGIAGSRLFTVPTPHSHSHEGEKLSQDMAGATESPPQNPHPLSESGIAGSRLFTVPTPHSHSHEGEKLSQEMAGATESPPQNPHPLCDSLNLPQMHEILKASQYNWFCVVEYTEEKCGLECSAPPLKEHLSNFYCHILYLCRPSDAILLKQSFEAFTAASEADLEDTRTAAAYNDNIVTDSEDEDLGELVRLSSLASKRAKEVIAQKRKGLVRHVKRQKAKALADRRFLSRTVSKKVKNIVDKFPDIGKSIEAFVEASNVGADAWRR